MAKRSRDEETKDARHVDSTMADLGTPPHAKGTSKQDTTLGIEMKGEDNPSHQKERVLTG